MRKTVFVIRHAKATGQAPDAPLTAEGELQAEALAQQFATVNIDRILSSPYVRAVQSIAPLTRAFALPIETDERLVERVLSPIPLTDWMTALQVSFEDLDCCWEGGESSRVAMQRASAVIDDVLAHTAQTTMIVTHGNLMTLLLKRFDPTLGFAFWQQLTNPDIYRVHVQGGEAQLDRVALSMVSGAI
jgi:2,3-bisphosphoglycerate-dependent phosphoglycerate mutase